MLATLADQPCYTDLETAFLAFFFEGRTVWLPHTYSCIAEGLDHYYDVGAIVEDAPAASPCLTIDFQR